MPTYSLKYEQVTSGIDFSSPKILLYGGSGKVPISKNFFDKPLRFTFKTNRILSAFISRATEEIILFQRVMLIVTATRAALRG